MIRPERMRGAAEARRNYNGVIIYENGTPCTMHCITNVTVTVDDGAESAASRSYFTVIQCVPDFPLQPIFSGRYQDRFTRIDGGWWWSERAVVGDLYGDISRHVKYGPPESR